jgi:hypothetical protein
MRKPFLSAASTRHDLDRYVVTPAGARIRAGEDTPASAILSLHRHAEAHAAFERAESARKRRAA